MVRARALAADRSRHDAGYVEHMASREHIVPAIEQAIRKFGQTPSPRRKARQYPGVPPHFAGKPIPARRASTALQDTIEQFFRPGP